MTQDLSLAQALPHSVEESRRAAPRLLPDDAISKCAVVGTSILDGLASSICIALNSELLATYLQYLSPTVTALDNRPWLDSSESQGGQESDNSEL